MRWTFWRLLRQRLVQRQIEEGNPNFSLHSCTRVGILRSKVEERCCRRGGVSTALHKCTLTSRGTLMIWVLFIFYLKKKKVLKIFYLSYNIGILNMQLFTHHYDNIYKWCSSHNFIRLIGTVVLPIDEKRTYHELLLFPFFLFFWKIKKNQWLMIQYMIRFDQTSRMVRDTILIFRTMVRRTEMK